MSAEITLNPALVTKIQNYMNDPVYRETIENAAQYNSRLGAERTMRLPFLDSQTGVAQNHSNLWMEARQRLPGLREGQIYTYPSKRWKKKRRQYLSNFMQPRLHLRKEPMDERINESSSSTLAIESAPFTTVTGTSGGAVEENKEVSSVVENKEIIKPPQEWYYDELDVPDAGEFEEPDADSDYDYEESYSKRKKKKATPKAPRQQNKNRRKITYDPITDAEKPFACDLCGARYKTRPGLTYHYTHSHKEKEDEEEDEMVPASPKRDEASRRRGGGGMPPPILHPQQPVGVGLQPPTLQPQQPLPPTLHNMPISTSSSMMPPPQMQMHHGGHHPPPPHLIPQQPPHPHMPPGPHQVQPIYHHPPPPGSNLPPPPGAYNVPPQQQGHQQQQQLQPLPQQPPRSVANTTPTPPASGTAGGGGGSSGGSASGGSGNSSGSGNKNSTANGSSVGDTAGGSSSVAEDPNAPKKPDDGKPRVQPSPYCDFCLGDAVENKKSGSPEELVSCSDCGRSGHPTCLQFTANMIISVKKYRWQCIECKCCSICGTSDNDDQLLFCDDCDRGYHMYCLSPPLDAPPEGSWSCTLCLAEFHKQ